MQGNATQDMDQDTGGDGMQWKDYARQGGFGGALVGEKPIIGVYGMFQTGKSTLINCLLDDYVALTGQGLSTTSLTARFRYREAPELKYRSLSGKLAPTTIEEINAPGFVDRVKMDSVFQIEAKLPAALLRKCDIVDTPGFNANEQDTRVAANTLEEIHYVIFVVPNRSLYQYEKSVLLEIFRWKKPVLLLMNCSQGRGTEMWMPESAQNRIIREGIEGWIDSTGFRTEMINGCKVFPCNFLFYWYCQAAFDKSVSYIYRPGTIGSHIRSAMAFEDVSFSREMAVQTSGVPELIRFLTERTEQYDALTHTWR